MLLQAAHELANALRSKLGERIIGPAFPIIKRLQGQYQQEIKIKYEKTISDKKIKEYLLALLDTFYETTRYKKLE